MSIPVADLRSLREMREHHAAVHARIIAAGLKLIAKVEVVEPEPPQVPVVEQTTAARGVVAILPPWPWHEPGEPAEVPEPRHTSLPRIGDVQRVVCGYYGIGRQTLKSPARHHPLVRQRQVAMYLAAEVTGASLPQIGSKFGGRDHTTVLHAHKRIAAMVETDADIARQVAELTAALGAAGGAP